LIYKIIGNVKDTQGKPRPNLSVEAYDSDFGTSDDYVGNARTNNQGKFEITFDDKSSTEYFEILERRPDVYIILRDSYCILFKSAIQNEAQGPEIFFDITLKEQTNFEDPYANSFPRIIRTFNSIGDTIDISQVDVATSIAQLIRALGNWSYYTTPKIMQMYGYPGPQVPRFPKRLKHNHSLPWNRKNDTIPDGIKNGRVKAITGA
jgi:hypothetical protein